MAPPPTKFEQLEALVKRYVDDGARGVVFGYVSENGLMTLLNGDCRGLGREMRRTLEENARKMRGEDARE